MQHFNSKKNEFKITFLQMQEVLVIAIRFVNQDKCLSKDVRLWQ